HQSEPVVDLVLGEHPRSVDQHRVHLAGEHGPPRGLLGGVLHPLDLDVPGQLEPLGGDQPDLVGVRAPEDLGRVGEPHHHEPRDEEADDEALAPHLRPDLAPGDQHHRVHATASRKISLSEGYSEPKYSTCPASMAARRIFWSSSLVVVVSTCRPFSTVSSPGSPSAQSGPASATTTRSRRPAAARSSSTGPVATIRPRAMIPTESQSRSTSSSWWLEKMTATPP